MSSKHTGTKVEHQKSIFQRYFINGPFEYINVPFGFINVQMQKKMIFFIVTGYAFLSIILIKCRLGNFLSDLQSRIDVSQNEGCHSQ